MVVSTANPKIRDTVDLNGIHGLIVEAWGQGFMVGSIVILIVFVLANMKRGTWLHRLILLEVSLIA
jgi:hypothetical protein